MYRHYQKLDYQLVIEARKSNPCATLQMIADKFNCTRERIRQILKENDIKTKHSIQKYICLYCGKIILRYGKHKFCNRTCQKNYTKEHSLVELECEYCGNVFKRGIKQLKRYLIENPDKHIYCGSKCFGLAIGKPALQKYWNKHMLNGKRKHTNENINKIELSNKKKHIRARKHDYNLVWQKHLETGFGSVRLSRVLNISEHTLDNILRNIRKEKGICGDYKKRG